MRVVRCLCPSLSHRDLDGKIHHGSRATRSLGGDDVRLLWRGLLIPRGNEGQPGGAHGS